MLVWVLWQFYAEHGELNCPVMTDRLLLHFRVGPSMEIPLSRWTVSAQFLAGCMAHLLAELLLRELALPLVILQ